MFNRNAKPTRTNLDKRLFAALDALGEAEHMVGQMPADKNVAMAIGHAAAWVADARSRLNANKGKRG